jgi:hypothetical protein
MIRPWQIYNGEKLNITHVYLGTVGDSTYVKLANSSNAHSVFLTDKSEKSKQLFYLHNPRLATPMVKKMPLIFSFWIIFILKLGRFHNFLKIVSSDQAELKSLPNYELI